jgi:hypothetical protein
MVAGLDTAILEPTAGASGAFTLGAVGAMPLSQLVLRVVDFA